MGTWQGLSRCYWTGRVTGAIPGVLFTVLVTVCTAWLHLADWRQGSVSIPVRYRHSVLEALSEKLLEGFQSKVVPLSSNGAPALRL